MNVRMLLIGLGLTASTGIVNAADSPLWLRNSSISPDGKQIAFTYKGDIFVVPVTGGRAVQLTTNQAYDTNPMWSPDGKEIAFQSTRTTGGYDIYVIPAEGGTSRRITTASASESMRAWMNDSTLLFSSRQIGSPVTVINPAVNQLYTVNAKHPGRPKLYANINAMSADFDRNGKMVYEDKKGYENDFRKHERSSGTNDIWIKDGAKYTKLTDFNGHDKNPNWAANGDIVYVSEQDGTLNVWSMKGDGSGKKQLTRFTEHPVRSLSVADNGTMAFSWNGELYTLVTGAEPRKVNVQIISDDYNADHQKRLLTSGVTYGTLSPDGEEVAFVVRGDVYVTSVKYKTTRQITDTPGQERYVSWSPDGKSLVYDGERDGQWKLYIATNEDPASKGFAYSKKVSETLLYAPANGKPAQQPAYSPDGKKIAFLEDRQEIRVIDPKTKSVHTALDRKYNYSYSDGDVEFSWSPDSNWLLTSYIGIGGWNNTDVALVKEDGSKVVDLTESGYSDANSRWAMKGRAICYETGRYGMKSHGSWGNQWDVVIEFEAPYNNTPSKEREYIYHHMLSQVNDKFYDKNLHGVDWKKYGEAYARFLPHINNNYDFADLLSEILGELNASHTGGSYRPSGAKWDTGNLGAYFDDNYDGAGLKINEVLKRGPLSAKKYNVKPGDIITAIDGVTIEPGADYFPLLEGKADRNVMLAMKRVNGKSDTIMVKPVDYIRDLQYERWVERNEHIVDSVSGGRIGYVHIEGMDSESFSNVYSKLLGKYRNREAVVVDTRWNGGGWLHNDVALLLSGKKYVDYSPRGQYVGSDPFSQWTKPSVMLVNESNYSDAHGTPYTYQTLKIGDIVGAPIPGTMTAVWWETQVDPTIVFGIPQVTSLDINGKPLENKQLNPEVIIYNNPGDVERGHDAQLEGAVRHLLDKLKK